MKKLRISFPSQWCSPTSTPTKKVLVDFNTKLTHSSINFNEDYLLRVSTEEVAVISTLIKKVLELNENGKLELL